MRRQTWRICLTPCRHPTLWAPVAWFPREEPTLLASLSTRPPLQRQDFTCPLVLPVPVLCPYEFFPMPFIYISFSCLSRTLRSRPSCPTTRRPWVSPATSSPSSLMGQSFPARSCLLIWAWNLGTSLRSGAETLLPIGRPSWDPHYWTWRTSVPVALKS